MQYNAEWLEADGLGGYASMPLSGPRTRKYHGLLCSALTPPVKRCMLLADILWTVKHEGAEYTLSEQQYEGGTVALSSNVVKNVQTFPTIKTVFTIQNIGSVTFEYLIPRGTPSILVHISTAWQVPNIELIGRPLLSGRNHHELLNANEVWQEENSNNNITWKKDDYTIKTTEAEHYVSDVHFYEHILYTTEQKRGYEAEENLYSPGYFLYTNNTESTLEFSSTNEVHTVQELYENELQRRRQYSNGIYKTADDFIVERTVQESGVTMPAILAGYPWFTDWGRDTFIAMRGLLLSRERYKEAEQILLFWADELKNGLLPNRFIDESNQPEYNSIDSPLWFAVVCYEYVKQCQDVKQHTIQKLQQACKQIFDSFTKGTDYNIHVTSDGLLYSGKDGVQLTWMDAKYNDIVVTPRIGLPVEIQCLWLNVLHILVEWNSINEQILYTAKESFLKRFWNENEGALFDCITDDLADSNVRPNQVLAFGSLPFTIVTDTVKQQQIVECIAKHLLCPLGLRTLAPNSAAYEGVYDGSQAERDRAYHQGTAWPWLLGPYCDAYCTVYGTGEEQKQHLRSLWNNCIEQSSVLGANGICEVASGSEPNTPNGCPWQAWSIGEYIRIVKKYKL